MTTTRRVIGPNNVPTINLHPEQYSNAMSAVSNLMNSLQHAYNSISSTLGQQVSQNRAMVADIVNNNARQEDRMVRTNQQILSQLLNASKADTRNQLNIMGRTQQAENSAYAANEGRMNQAMNILDSNLNRGLDQYTNNINHITTTNEMLANKNYDDYSNKENSIMNTDKKIALSLISNLQKAHATIDQLKAVGFTEDEAKDLVKKSLLGSGTNSIAGLVGQSNGAGNIGTGKIGGLGGGKTNIRNTLAVTKLMGNANKELGNAKQSINKLNTLLPGSVVQDKNGNIMFNTNNKDLTTLLGLMGLSSNDLDKYTMSVQGPLGSVVKIPNAKILNKLNQTVTKINNGQISFRNGNAYITGSDNKSTLVNINAGAFKNIITNPNTIGGNLGYKLYNAYINYRKGNIGLDNAVNINVALDSELDDLLEDKRVKSNIINRVNSMKLTFDPQGNISKNGKPLAQLSGDAQERVVKNFLLNQITLPAVLNNKVTALKSEVTSTDWFDSNLKKYNELKLGVY